MKKLVLFLLLSATCANAAPTIGPANSSNSPLKLVQTTSGVEDWLISATVANEGKKTITAYKLGWAVVNGRSVKYFQGPWMNLPAGIRAGEDTLVPAQNVKPQMQASRLLFFVSQVKFADGSEWKANRDEVLKAGGVERR